MSIYPSVFSAEVRLVVPATNVDRSPAPLVGNSSRCRTSVIPYGESAVCPIGIFQVGYRVISLWNIS